MRVILNDMGTEHALFPTQPRSRLPAAPPRIGEQQPVSDGSIFVIFLVVMIGVSAILALMFRLWPRYGSVDAAIEASDRVIEQLDASSGP